MPENLIVPAAQANSPPTQAGGGKKPIPPDGPSFGESLDEQVKGLSQQEQEEETTSLEEVVDEAEEVVVEEAIAAPALQLKVLPVTIEVPESGDVSSTDVLDVGQAVLQYQGLSDEADGPIPQINTAQAQDSSGVNEGQNQSGAVSNGVDLNMKSVETSGLPQEAPKSEKNVLETLAKDNVSLEMFTKNDASVEKSSRDLLNGVEQNDSTQKPLDGKASLVQSTAVEAKAFSVASQGASQVEDDASQNAADQSRVGTPGKSSMTDPPVSTIPVNGTGVSAEGKILTSTDNELARLAEARNPEYVNQIRLGVERLSKSGETSLHIQLHPEELGRIGLRLTTGADGLHVSLTTDLATTGQLLESNLPKLIDALNNAGINVAGLDIGNLGQQDQQAAEFARQQPKAGRPIAGAPVQVAEDGSEAVLLTSVFGSGTRVDYLI